MSLAISSVALHVLSLEIAVVALMLMPSQGISACAERRFSDGTCASQLLEEC